MERQEGEGRQVEKGAAKMGAERQYPEEKRGASIEELAKRMVTINNSDEDLARILANNWQNVLWGILLLGIAIVVFREFQSTREKKAGEISQRFSEVQLDYRKLLDPPAPVAETPGTTPAATATGAPAVSPEVAPALNENLRLLTTNYSDDNYGRLARLYQASLMRKEKKLDEARKALAGLPVSGLLSTAQAKSLQEVAKNDFVLELAALVTVRTNLDDPKVPAAESRKQLASLAYGSRFVTGEALLSLFRISYTHEQKQEAQKVAKSVLDSRVALKGALMNELAEADIQLEGVPGAGTLAASQMVNIGPADPSVAGDNESDNVSN